MYLHAFFVHVSVSVFVSVSVSVYVCIYLHIAYKLSMPRWQVPLDAGPAVPVESDSGRSGHPVRKTPFPKEPPLRSLDTVMKA